ncbi:hypothetical protein PJX95_11710 [Serratia rubidaea]|uniref:hypothetical protein n=1 Tax=Serratia rubidaea TaxID=61652 RepID=UPI00234AAFE9|nr:hypothetical protein [Serratia rubidaea]MDC6118718.1 hypothetical protein [Serratia rubidaea]
MPTYISLFEPKKKALAAGAVPLVIALDAPSKRAAESIALGKLFEAYPEGGDSFLAPKTVEDQPGAPRPAVGQFDEQFAAENEFDGKVWSPKATEPEPEAQTGAVDLMSQPANVRIAAVVIYGDGEIDNSQLSLVVDMLNDDETPDDTGMRAVIDGLVSVPKVGIMLPIGIYRLVSAIFQQAGESMPSQEDVAAFAHSWVTNPNDRENLKLSGTATNVAAENDAPAESVHDEERGYPHTLDSLDYEISAALLPMDFDIFNIPLAIHRRAKEVVAKKESPWKEWSAILRKTTGVLEFSRAQIFDLIRSANPDLHQFPTSHREYINANLGRLSAPKDKAKEPQVASLGDGKFTIAGLTGEQQETASNQVEKTEVDQQQEVNDATAEQAKQQLDQMCYGVYASAPEDKSPALQQAEENAERAEELAKQLKADDFQQRAAQVEQVIAEQPAEAQQNLDIWKRVMRTDPRYTKPIEGAGYVGTSINSEYMFMRATEIFGPIGTGWGFDIVEEKMIAGAPMSEAVFEGGKIIGNRILRDADGSILFEQNHSLQVEFWYVLNGTKGRVTAYGATPYMYKTRRGFMADSEVMKKSLTDAIKKSLSMLGFSADVFLGWHDLPEYREENATEFAIKNASDKAEDVTRLREELDEKLSAVADTISTAVTVNEASKVYSSIAREVETHRKAAEAKGDTEHAKYLASRLRRLTVLKEERIATLSKEKAS